MFLPNLLSKVLAGATAVLVAICLFLWVQNGNLSDALVLERTKTEINVKSIEDLTKALNQKNEESEARARDLAEATAKAARAEGQLAATYRTTQGTIDRLLGSVGRAQGDDRCETPQEIVNALPSRNNR